MSVRIARMSAVIIIFVVFCASAACAQTQPKDQSAKTGFPTRDQINLVVSQAERAFDSYSNAVQLESQLSGDTQQIQQMVSRDTGVLDNARKVIRSMKANPESFNSPLGFLLVGNLDDASCNMALCQGQAGLQATTALQNGDAGTAGLRIHLAQTCLDSSTLLYTVGETAFSMYADYLTAYAELAGSASEALTKCSEILKSQKK